MFNYTTVCYPHIHFMISRRRCITALAWLPLLRESLAKGARTPRLLVRACWQSFHMGEVAQVAGLLQLLQRELPSVKITLWASSLASGVDTWLTHHFPKVKCITGTTGNDGKPDQPNLQKAWDQSDFLLHGPSTHVVARDHLDAWHKHHRKPFGIYGVTLDNIDPKLKLLLDAACFVLLRDGPSRALTIREGVRSEHISFVPDAALALNLRDDTRATEWLKAHALHEEPFICLVTKCRFTPYWDIFARTPRPAEIPQMQLNQQWLEADHKLLRDTLIQYLSLNAETRILCVAEMPYQVALAKEHILGKLPPELQARCIVRDTPWFPDEAAGIFAQAHFVLTMDLLSAVVAETVGTTAIHLRPSTDATQGQMWSDLGLTEWLFEMHRATPAQLSEALILIKQEPERKARILAQANEFIRLSENTGLQLVKDSLAKY
jgi:hypothetical protein